MTSAVTQAVTHFSDLLTGWTVNKKRELSRTERTFSEGGEGMCVKLLVSMCAYYEVSTLQTLLQPSHGEF